MSSKVPTLMKAWQCLNYSRLHDPNELIFNNAMRVPSPRAHEVLVKVLYAAVNPVDVRILEGGERFPARGSPFVPGLDAAGEIAAVGERCSQGFQVGDRVVLCNGLAESYAPDAASCPAGSFAQYCTCPEDRVCKVPPGVQLSAAAGLPLAGLSAYQALLTGRTLCEALADVAEGSKVLILGGDRGPGHIAMQLAHNAGAEVVTTASPKKLDLLRSLGADRVVDWKERDWTEQLRYQGFDLVLDCVGWMASPEEMGRAVKVMKPGAEYISILPDFEAFEPEGVIKDRYFKAMIPKIQAEDLRVLLQMMAEGKLRVCVDKSYWYEELPYAIEHSARGQTTGKVIVSMEHNISKGVRSGSQGGA